MREIIWTYTERHAHTLRHRHTHTYTHSPVHTHHMHTNMCTIAAHTPESGTACFTVCFPYTRSHSQIYTNTLYKSLCAQTPTHSLLNSLFLTRPRTHSHTLLHVNIVDKPSLNLSLHILLWPFWQTDDEERFKMEMYDMFPL